MGPSEVVIVAGEDADPEWIAADLLAQAEHDPRAAALLVTTSRRLARARRGGGRPPASGARDGRDGARLAARLRWSAAGRRSRRRGGSRRGDRSRAPAARRRRDRGSSDALPHRRGDLRRRTHAGGLRRLCRGPEPRPADLRHGPLRLRSLGRDLQAADPPNRGARRGAALPASPPLPQLSPAPRGCRRTRPRPPPGRGGT